MHTLWPISINIAKLYEQIFGIVLCLKKKQVLLKCSGCYLSSSIAAFSVQSQKFVGFLIYNPSSYTSRLSMKIIERFVLAFLFYLDIYSYQIVFFYIYLSSLKPII